MATIVLSNWPQDEVQRIENLERLDEKELMQQGSIL
jgi:hypothetical protein